MNENDTYYKIKNNQAFYSGPQSGPNIPIFLSDYQH